MPNTNMDLIDISDDEFDYNEKKNNLTDLLQELNDKNIRGNIVEEKTMKYGFMIPIEMVTATTESEDSEDELDIQIVEKELNDKDPEILKFIRFCIKHRLFDDSFYDYSNIFSAVATKLPNTFNTMSGGKNKVSFDNFNVLYKKKYKYRGNISYIFKYIDNNQKGYVTWEDFKDFFIPFVKNITF